VKDLRIPSGMAVLSPDNLAPDSCLHDSSADHYFHQEFGTVFKDIKGHLTEDECLCLSLYKNSKQTRNNGPYCAFFKRVRGKTLSSSLVVHHKRRLLKVLRYVGELLRFKRDNNVDDALKEILTDKQYMILMLYERRVPLQEIQHKVGHNHKSTTSAAFARALAELLTHTDRPLIKRYVELLSMVLHFSRIRKII